MREQTAGKIHSPALFRFKDWKKIAGRLKRQVQLDNLGIVSAGVAFYTFLGIFPMLAAFVSLYGFLAAPEDVMRLVEQAQGVVPAEILAIFETQLTRLAAESQVASLAAIISVLAALWTGSKAVKGMMSALNIVYGEEESRGFFKKNGVALLLTLGGIFTGMICVFLLAVLPVALRLFGLADSAGLLGQIVRWSLLAVIIISASSILYRWAPDRKKAKWRWITPGSTLASIVWLFASGLFSWYVSNFANYNKTYGSLGAIAILMLWLSLSAFVFMFGAEIDSEMERQAGINHKDELKRKTS